jgi:hypothetical protein
VEPRRIDRVRKGVQGHLVSTRPQTSPSKKNGAVAAPQGPLAQPCNVHAKRRRLFVSVLMERKLIPRILGYGEERNGNESTTKASETDLQIRQQGPTRPNKAQQGPTRRPNKAQQEGPTRLLNKAPQQGSSTRLLNKAPQQGSSTRLLNKAPQQGSSTRLNKAQQGSTRFVRG